MMHVYLAALSFVGGMLGIIGAVVHTSQQMKREGAIRDKFGVAVLTVAGVWLLIRGFMHLFAANGWIRMGTIFTNPLIAVAVAAMIGCLVFLAAKSWHKDKPSSGP